MRLGQRQVQVDLFPSMLSENISDLVRWELLAGMRLSVACDLLRKQRRGLVRGGVSGCGLQVIGRYGDSEFSEPLQVITDLAIFVSLVEVIGPEITIGNAFGEDVIDGDEKDTRE